jgi:D-beta-D-heptose 7-phosphate kinase/D-beta-D-heptose 1-phosphate adenosyltransferase
VVDPKGRDYGKYMGCTLLTPNQKEASVATDIVAESESDVLKAGKSLLSSLPGSSVLITRGPDGMTLFCPNADPLTISTEAQNVFDVVGAGDTVIATLGVSMAARLSLETAVTLSNIAAGIVVGKHGTVAITREELLACANTSTTLRNALHGRLCA